MVKAMNTNKIVIYVTLIFSLLVIGIPTFYKVTKNHHSNLELVTQKQILEAAQNCFYEQKCPNDKITLKELYNQKYLVDEVIDPLTKIVYDYNSYVLVDENGFNFYPQN